jgi:20S proteasome subunit beta 7
LDDGHKMTPKQWHTALQALQYERRCRGDPLWMTNVVCGISPTQRSSDSDAGSVFLGVVDKLGNSWEADSVATGFGAYLAQPLLRDALGDVQGEHKLLSETEAIELLERCLRVLFLRDARASSRVQMCKVTPQEGVVISAPYELTCDWSIANF